jgi:hypothetical protein
MTSLIIAYHSQQVGFKNVVAGFMPAQVNFTGGDKPHPNNEAWTSAYIE